jgi:hypothetical protein
LINLYKDPYGVPFNTKKKTSTIEISVNFNCFYLEITIYNKFIDKISYFPEKNEKKNEYFQNIFMSYVNLINEVNKTTSYINKIDICNDECFFEKIKQVNDDQDIWEFKKFQLYYLIKEEKDKKNIINFIKKKLNENNIIVYIFE